MPRSSLTVLWISTLIFYAVSPAMAARQGQGLLTCQLFQINAQDHVSIHFQAESPLHTDDPSVRCLAVNYKIYTPSQTLLYSWNGDGAVLSIPFSNELDERQHLLIAQGTLTPLADGSYFLVAEATIQEGQAAAHSFTSPAMGFFIKHGRAFLSKSSQEIANLEEEDGALSFAPTDSSYEIESTKSTTTEPPLPSSDGPFVRHSRPQHIMQSPQPLNVPQDIQQRVASEDHSGLESGLLSAKATPVASPDLTVSSSQLTKDNQDIVVPPLPAASTSEGVAPIVTPDGFAAKLPSEKTVSEYSAPVQEPVQTIQVVGTVYSDAGITPLDQNLSLTLLRNGSPVATGSTNSQGQFILDVNAQYGDILTLYLSSPTHRAVIISKVANAAVLGLDLFKGHLILRTEGALSLTSEELVNYNHPDAALQAILRSSSPLSLDILGHLVIPGGHIQLGAAKVDIRGDVTITGGELDMGQADITFWGKQFFKYQNGVVSMGTSTMRLAANTAIDSKLIFGSPGGFSFYDLIVDIDNDMLITSDVTVSHHLMIRSLGGYHGRLQVRGNVTTVVPQVIQISIHKWIHFIGPQDHFIDANGGYGFLPTLDHINSEGQLILKDHLLYTNVANLLWSDTGMIDPGESTLEFIPKQGDYTLPADMSLSGGTPHFYNLMVAIPYGLSWDTNITQVTIHNDFALTGGLIGYWPCEDPFMSVLADLSGRYQHGVLGSHEPQDWSTDIPMLQIPNTYSLSWNTDDSNDYVLLPSLSVQGARHFTISLWFKTSKQGSQRILSSANQALDIRFLSSTQIQAKLNNHTVTWTVPSIANDTWHHLGIVRKTNRQNDFVNITLYLDQVRGKIYGGLPLAPEHIHIVPDKLVLGHNQSVFTENIDPTDAFVGYMDEIRFYNYPLTDAQISALAQGQNPTPAGSLTLTGPLHVPGNFTLNGQLNANGHPVTVDGTWLTPTGIYIP